MASQGDLFDVNDLFGHSLAHDELDKVGDYYTHADGWTNRLILGDSLLGMNSLLEKEGYAGKVQCIYIDPPYGIKYGSNWQIKLNSREVRDGSDDHLSAEPEQIRAFRDTWELGIHSYLSYLRDRLLVARELLSESGSCFVQISDENVHLVRCLMDEVFGSGNFCKLIIVQKTGGLSQNLLPGTSDFIIWYCRDITKVKFRQLYFPKEIGEAAGYRYIELPNGERRSLSKDEIAGNLVPKDARVFQPTSLESDNPRVPFEYHGKKYSIRSKTTVIGLQKLADKRRLFETENSLRYVRFLDDFPVMPITNVWTDTGSGSFLEPSVYVVQTPVKAIQRCILMTTDPGDLVLDPTCGSGTTAYVAEQWGRRWITMDTSRIALNIAKTRIASATYPFYHLADSAEGWDAEQKMRAKRGLRVQGNDEKPQQFRRDLRQGFVYRKVPHITLKSLANDLPPDEETLFDQPEVDSARLRVAGPFTVETLQSLDVANPAELERHEANDDNFMTMIFTHLRLAGIRNGLKNETARFHQLEVLAEPYCNAQGWWKSSDGSDKRALFFIGPRFGTVSRHTVNEAAKMVRALAQKGEQIDWFVVLGFAFEDGLAERTQNQGLFELSIVRMHDDLLQEGLSKKDKKAASFVTIGEPEIKLATLDNGWHQVEVQGIDIFDPMSGQLKSRDVEDIAYWYLDDDYDGSNFVTRQIFFCGGDKDEFDKWRKGLESLAAPKARRKAEHTLGIELDEEAWDRLYGYKSHPIPPRQGKRQIAVRVVSQFGEESTKVLMVEM